ncbi:TonB-dependent receptor, partial [Novosphingobium sp. 17-62-19]|uniref:TonB-dependent receptor plug domain-containing protein n=1 Tax=Novosphingobium sp. 17-62-19 TaxID=1970406 RepID=UPI0025FAB0C9
MARKTRYMLGTMLALPLAVMASGAAVAQEAQAQTSEDVQELERQIIVTGSYIRGTSENDSLPVEVYTTAELSQRGIDSPLEFIRTLPSVGITLGESNQYAAGGSQGVGSINLRGLGRERTLVLMNGRRFFPEPGDGASDTNLIPMFALQRVEVLKDGASTTYGSDAIAGVANFVTRKNFTGVEVSGNYQFVRGSKGNYQASILAGHDFGTANLMVGFGYQHRSELSTRDRDFTDVPYAVNPSGWSFLNDVGSYIPKLGSITQGVAGRSLGLGVDGQLSNACGAIGGLAGTFPSGASNFPVCRYSFIPFVNLIEEEHRYQGYAQLDVDLSDSLRFVADVLYSHTDVPTLGYSPSYPPTSGPRGPGSSQAFFVPRSNPGYNTFLAQTFPAGNPAYLSGYSSILFFRPFGLTGNPLDPEGSGQGAAYNNAWRVTAGFEKEFSPNFRAELYGTFLRSHRTAYSFDILGGRLQNALNGLGGPNCTGTTPGANGCQYFNPFVNSRPGNPALGLDNPLYVPGNENSAALVEWMRAKNGTKAHEEQRIVDLVFSGSFNIGIPFDYAFGAQYRSTNFVSRGINSFNDPAVTPCAIEGDRTCLDDPNDLNFPTGPFIFLGQYPTANQSQSVYAIFAEAKIIPFTGFELNGAVRYEDYGGSVGSTFNPKLNARWQMTDWLALRGSVGDTFRGPLPGDLSPNGASAVAGINVLGNNFKAIDSGGNPNLKPETALTYNIGAIIDAGGFSFTADYWTYKFKGRFTDLPVQAIAALVAPGGTNGQQAVNCASPFVQFVVFEGGVCTASTIGLDISRIRRQTVNGPDSTVSGLDFGLNYQGEVGGVKVDFGVNATHVLKYTFSDFVYEGLTFSPGYDAAGLSNYDRAPGTVSKWRGNAFASFGVGPVTATYNLLYIDGVTDNRCQPNVPCATTPEFGGTDFGREIGSYPVLAGQLSDWIAGAGPHGLRIGLSVAIPTGYIG